MRIRPDEYNADDFRSAIANEGFCIVENLIPVDQVLALRDATAGAIQKEAAYHGNTSYRDYGIVQACPLYGGSFLTLLENRPFIEPFNHVMGEGCILYVYISSSMPPHSPNFSSRIHVDRPKLFQGYCECLAGLLLLSDFTQENGSTYFLPGSQNMEQAPDESYFYDKAEQLIAPAGSVFYFNLRLWHSGGKNSTDQWRHALALGMVRPNLKQKFDLPKLIVQNNVDDTIISNYAKQKLGYFAIPPASLEEFYGTPENRTYKEKSEWLLDK